MDNTTSWPDAWELTPAERAAGEATACQCTSEGCECELCRRLALEKEALGE